MKLKYIPQMTRSRAMAKSSGMLMDSSLAMNLAIGTKSLILRTYLGLGAELALVFFFFFFFFLPPAATSALPVSSTYPLAFAVVANHVATESVSALYWR